MLDGSSCLRMTQLILQMVLVSCVSATIIFTATSSTILKRDILVQVHSLRWGLQVFALFFIKCTNPSWLLDTDVDE